jgi:hypothetical protein
LRITSDFSIANKNTLQFDSMSGRHYAASKFTGSLGGALAGRPIAIRYIDNRELGQSSSK